MKSKHILSIAILIGVALVAWFFFKPGTQTPQQQEPATNAVAAANPAIHTPASNSVTLPPPVAVANTKNSNLRDNPSYPADTVAKYRQGTISKGEAIQEIFMAKNYQSQDFYGKVIDQNGQPIQNVVVTGEVVLNTEIYGGFKTQVYTTQTDVAGLFEFTGLQGASFNVRIKKSGYIMGARGEGYKGPVGKQTSPTDRAVLTMWKIRGVEPLTR